MGWKYVRIDKDFRASNGEGRIAMIRKNEKEYGGGYIVDPILGFGGVNPFGCWVYRNIVAAKKALEDRK